MKILALGHKSRTGKDTAAKFLVSYLQKIYPNSIIEQRAFAVKVKDISHQLYKSHGLMPGSYYDVFPEARTIKLPSLNMDPVEIWVRVGNLIREVHPETWIDLILLDHNIDFILVSDLRYKDEARRIQQLGGLCVKIDRKEAPIRNTVADNALNDFNDWYRIIDNNGTVEELEQKLVQLLRDIKWIE